MTPKKKTAEQAIKEIFADLTSKINEAIKNPNPGQTGSEFVETPEKAATFTDFRAWYKARTGWSAEHALAFERDLLDGKTLMLKTNGKGTLKGVRTLEPKAQ